MNTAPFQAPPSVSPQEFQAVLQSHPGTRLLDVRTAPEFQAAHIRQARLLPLDDIRPERVDQFHGGGPIYVICQSGMRARKAIEKLSRAGLRDCVLVDGGMDAWTSAGLPVERGASKVLPLMRQVQLVIGISTAAGAVLALTVHPLFALVPLVTGCGLTINGLTGFCGLALLMARMPWNKRGACASGGCC